MPPSPKKEPPKRKNRQAKSAKSAKSERDASEPTAPANFRRKMLIFWGIGVALLAALAVDPVSSGFTRAGSLVLLAALALGALVLGWRWVALRATLLVLYVAAALFWLLPGSPNYNRVLLRQETARALERYEGVRWFFGGETTLGIDSSGLIRRGIIHALWQHGWQTGNPFLLRKAASIWWNDTDTQALCQGARRKVRPLGVLKALKNADFARLSPGDFAVTPDRTHALVYLGDAQWLEADREQGRVRRLDARANSADTSPQLQLPVRLYRWRVLDPEFRVGRQP